MTRPLDDTTVCAVLDAPGTVLPATRLLSYDVVALVVLRPQVHTARLRTGDGPQLDPDTLTIWEWPQSNAPGPALTLSGVVFRTRHNGFPRALADARAWRVFSPAAVIAPADLVADPLRRWDCELHGVGLTSPHPASPLVPATPGRLGPRRRVINRWIEEHLYALALHTGSFARPDDRMSAGTRAVCRTDQQRKSHR